MSQRCWHGYVVKVVSYTVTQKRSLLAVCGSLPISSDGARSVGSAIPDVDVGLAGNEIVHLVHCCLAALQYDRITRIT